MMRDRCLDALLPRSLGAFVMLLVVFPFSLHALENWETSSSTMPPAFATSLVKFNNALYAADQDCGLFKLNSNDQWDAVTIPIAPQTCTAPLFLVVHGTSFFIVGSDPPFYRSPDGETWTQVDNTAFPETIKNVISWGSNIYVFFHLGDIQRTDGTGVSLSWTDVGSLGVNVDLPPSAAELNGNLHISATDITTNPPDFESKIFRTSNGTVWTEVSSATGTYNTGFKEFQLIAFENELYRRTTSLQKSDGTGIPYQWEEVATLATRDQPFVVFNNLYILSYINPLRRLTADGSFEKASDFRMSIFGIIPDVALEAVELNNISYLSHFLIFKVQKGLWNVRQIIISNRTIFPGQTNRPIMGFQADVNGTEDIQFVLATGRTANHEEHIEKVSLVRMIDPGGWGGTFENLITLTPDPQDNQRWTMANPVSIDDGDELFITLDVYGFSQSAQMIMRLNNFTTINNPDYSLEGLNFGYVYSIRPDPLSTPIPETDVFPQPGQNQVTFRYDLTSQSDVHIKLFDLYGNLVSEIQDLGKTPGTGVQTTWNSTDKANGAYLALIKIRSMSGEERILRKKVFIKK
ncbi:hypothetical protein BVX98_06630 [bacterium F11]|nr:hypothetical protein BVX98_06630 [bacterium F11]